VYLLRHAVFGGNNLSQAYEVIQELLRSKQESQMLAQFYANFNKLFEKIKEIFFLSQLMIEPNLHTEK